MRDHRPRSVAPRPLQARLLSKTRDEGTCGRAARAEMHQGQRAARQSAPDSKHTRLESRCAPGAMAPALASQSAARPTTRCEARSASCAAAGSVGSHFEILSISPIIRCTETMQTTPIHTLESNAITKQPIMQSRQFSGTWRIILRLYRSHCCGFTVSSCVSHLVNLGSRS